MFPQVFVGRHAQQLTQTNSLMSMSLPSSSVCRYFMGSMAMLRVLCRSGSVLVPSASDIEIAGDGGGVGPLVPESEALLNITVLNSRQLYLEAC